MRVETYRMSLSGIRFRGRHGASKAERGLLQDFVVDLDVELPVSALPRTDTLSRVFDYGKLADLVVQVGTGASYRLLESLARAVLERLFEVTPALSATIDVRKFGPPTAVSVDAASIRLSGRAT